MLFKDLYRRKPNKLFFTTPSHSQKFCLFHKFRQFYKYDISETDFHCPNDVLSDSQKMASKIYGTNQTLYLTNGSSSGIICAVLATVAFGENVLIWDKAHKSHQNAVKLSGGNACYYSLDKDVDWDVYLPLSAQRLEQHLKTTNIKAVIVTSPSYEGLVCDIKSLKLVCDKYGAVLIVDEAHGALYPFSDKLPSSAIEYADIVVQSLHKTAGGLNPTALIHSNLDIDLRPSLDLITTTSPSYALLATIEKNILYLNSKKGRAYIDNLVDSVEDIKSKTKTLAFFGDDATKILVKSSEMSGYELSELLYTKYSIEDERTNSKSTMLLCGIGTDKSKLKKLAKVFSKL